MKRFTLVFLIAILTLSCSDTITRDETVFQTMIDNDFFRSQTGVAYLNDEGHLTIESTTNESVKLTTEFSQPGIYTLAPTGVNSATYKTYLGDVYTSKHSNIDGVIEILQINEDGYDGNFNFNAVNETGDTIVFHKGAFFNVPLGNPGGGDIDEPGDLPTEYMLATIDGTLLETQGVTRSISDGRISVTGDFDGAEINISYPETLEPGTYTIADQADLSMDYTEGGTLDAATSGQLTINAAENGFYLGTFNFTTESELLIEAGSFNVQ
ncbi:MAG: DUF6252 family protein [Psychroflexus halocasei]|uniref:DUF6252 family protein n=1 Tax=Psychroflexus sp. S27 TaxID=1982757 RepID=UPI000C2AC3BF|nr:DUF6252 family protein [Psychroflexus sp. S27]PJX22739.1 hypothetical protein CAP47_06845 [Psychroflexus sp. S27]